MKQLAHESWALTGNWPVVSLTGKRWRGIIAITQMVDFQRQIGSRVRSRTGVLNLMGVDGHLASLLLKKSGGWFGASPQGELRCGVRPGA